MNTVLQIEKSLQIVKSELSEIKKNSCLLEKIRDENYTLDVLYDNVIEIYYELATLTSYYGNRRRYKKTYAEKDTRRKKIILLDEDFFEKAVDIIDYVLREWYEFDGQQWYDWLGLLYFFVVGEIKYFYDRQTSCLTYEMLNESISFVVENMSVAERLFELIEEAIEEDVEKLHPVN